MSKRVEQRIGQLLVIWVEGVRRRALWISAGMILGAGAALFYAATHLQVNTDARSLVSPELPHKVAERRYLEAFPVLSENLLVVIDAPTSEQARAAAAALVQRLETEIESVRRVYLPGGGDFFDQHAFLYLDTEELQDLADQLARVQPYLAGLARDGSLRGLVELMERGVMAVRDGEAEASDLLPMYQRFGDAVDARLAGESYQLSWAEVIADRDMDLDARRRFVVVTPILDFSDLQPGRLTLTAVRRAAQELELDARKGIVVRITGDPALSFEEWGVIRTQAAWAGIASFLMVGVLLFLALRSARLVVATLLNLLVGLIYTAGFATAAIGHLNMISVAFAVLFIGLSVDFGIHLCLRYRDFLGLGCDHAQALRESSRDVGSALVLCAVTTAIGFFAFVPTDFSGVAELGLISGAGMFISLFCSLTLLPALMSLRAPSRAPAAPRVQASALTRLGGFPRRHARAVRVAAVLLTLASLPLLPEARFDHNPLRVRDPSTEAVQTFRELLTQGRTSPWTLNAIASDLEAAEGIAAKLRGLEEVERVITLSDFVPESQDEKLAIIEDVSLFLPPPPGPDGVPPRPAYAEQVAALRAFRARIEGPIDGAEAEELEEVNARLLASLDLFLARLETARDSEQMVADLEASLLGSLDDQLEALESALTARPIALGDLPRALVERMVAADGRVRVQVFPREDLNDNAALERFVEAVRGVSPEIAGDAVTILESGRAVVGAFQQAFVSAVVAITLLLLVLWRQVADTTLVLVPLGMAALLTCAAAVLLGIPFNFADVIVLPLLLGIGVDSGIHLVHRARNASESHRNLLATSTARGVAYAALTTVASFGSLGFATHRGLATLGQLLTLGVAMTLLCNLVLLPALIELRAAKSRGEPQQAS